jgi:hypothetical protein
VWKGREFKMKNKTKTTQKKSFSKFLLTQKVLAEFSRNPIL